ncbi:uncharacterized protein LOC123559447 isoform X2 [Mercenaria mercenaria]|uniref:uncharacterized protein LOC123559447 isoform X2 n=1 Tax=Mercenaria mercenaria TaxID=6596 RepID=UPI00234E5086|nr:uncharacterized protein LOC123559447 isoform X2 [Mercenaria mercenaria]
MSQTVCGGKDHISLYKTSTKDFQQPVIFRRKSKTWNDAAKLCFKQYSYPTPVESINHVTDTNFFSWTGVVRSGVISKNTDLASMSSDIMHGYMTYDDSSGYTLKFTRQANDRKYILCENANVTVKPNIPMRTSVTTTQEYQLTTSRNGSSSNVTDTQNVTEASNPTITVSYATATQVNGSTMSLNDNSYNGKNTQGSDATVIVIVSVSVVMLIVIVVVILIQVKRKKIPFLCQRELTNEEPGQKHLKSTKNPTSHENHSYELVDVEDNVIGGQSADSNYTHTYNVLEEHVKDSITDDTTYDVSGNNRKATETENENIYNKLKPDDNATYDHVYNTTKHSLQTPDITYGTSGNAGMKPLARAAKNSDAFDENGENAYSHTLNNRPHMTTTDNVYSAHGQAGNDTRDTGEGHNDKEDAYSHINNATNGRSKQDIAYGKITEGCPCYETDDESNWAEATQKCALATPDVTLGSEGYRADIQDEDWHGQVWTGYYMTIQGFEYIGCVKIAERKANFVSHLNAPGICHSACGKSNIIGMHGEECFCLNNESFNNNTLPYCDKMCDAQKGIVCGGHQHISLYKVSNVTGVKSGDHIERSCLGLEFQHVSKIFRWKQCSSYLRPLCTYVDSKTHTGDRHYPWNTASNECFKQQTIPTSYQSALEFKTILTGIYWTGTIRSQTIHKYDGKHEEGDHIRYGYLDRNDFNVTVVLFSDSNKKMKSLCKKDSTEEPSTGKQKISVPTYVIIIVVAVVLAIAVVVVFCLLKKRKLEHIRRQVPVRYASEQNEYVTPIFKEDDDRIYSEIPDNRETDTTEDGYEVPLQKPIHDEKIG